jgi:TetR/AcrR family transcriptional repressor of nem operon
MSRKNEKRERLIDAADELIYQQTFNSTTLADIATRADVPLGNVYYYFKTKDDILKAVVQKRAAELHSQFSAWEQQLPNAKERLRAFITHSTQTSEVTAQYGCSLGSLCQELGKYTGELAGLAEELMHKTLGWVETQFKSLNKGEQSTTLAKYLIASIQGVSLLTLTFKDPSLLQRQTKNLETWLEAA